MKGVPNRQKKNVTPKKDFQKDRSKYKKYKKQNDKGMTQGR